MEITRFNKLVIDPAACLPVTNTSSWLSGVDEIPAAQFVRHEKATTGTPSARA